MQHEDHVQLLRDGITETGGVWADLGSGRGAFTLALAEILDPEATIYSVDIDRKALQQQARAMTTRFPEARVHYLAANFTQAMDLPPLDGIVMANALHFVRDKAPIVRHIRGYLRPGGRFLLVEYNADQGNPWVPYPLTYETWEGLAARCGYVHTRLLATVPSRFLGEIYSAISW